MSYLLPEFIINKYIESALQEDIGHGDITADSLVEPGDTITAYMNSRSEGIVAGIEIVKKVFKALDADIEFAGCFSR